MMLSDIKKRELEVRGTSTLLATTALSVALIIAQYTPSIEEERDNIQLAGTKGTFKNPFAAQLEEMDLFKQINRIYDHLLKDQIALDAVSKRALYSNLWDLYT